MVEMTDLLKEARKANIAVYFWNLPQTKSLSVCFDDCSCAIGMDNSRAWSSRDKREHFAHELSHCLTGAFYNRYSPVDNRGKCEQIATRAEIRKLIPFEQLRESVRQTQGQIWEIAEHFGVTEDLVRSAYSYYTEVCGLRIENGETQE